MSSNRNLGFIEQTPNNWFYVLEDWSAPSDSWDWHEYAKAYGPFSNLEAAQEHQYDFSRISTGGSEITTADDYRPSVVTDGLLSRASLELAY